MLTNRILQLYHLIKPKISSYNSVQHLIESQQIKAIKQIQQYNNSNLQKNKNETKLQKITKILNITNKFGQQILKKQYETSIFNIQSKIYTTYNNSISSNQINYNNNNNKIYNSEISYYLPNINHIPVHSSFYQTQRIQEQYSNHKMIIYVFNLPNDIHQSQIALKLGIQNIQKITFGYCILGLPAYAKVKFNSEDSINMLILNGQNQIKLGQKQHICHLYTSENLETNCLENRQLVLKGIPKYIDMNQLLLELSRYGRVVHFDVPSRITRNCSEKVIKKHYEFSQNPICIRTHKKDGRIQIEYYPMLNNNESKEDVEQQLKKQRAYDFMKEKQEERQLYRKKCTYAQNVDIYEGLQEEILLINNGYCIVTYASMQQAQNCYFCLKNTFEIQLKKQKQQFEFDEQYKKSILRFIDNEYHKQQKYFDKQQEIRNNIAPNIYEILGTKLYAQLARQQIYHQGLKQNQNEDSLLNPIKFNAIYQKRLKQIKYDMVGKYLGTKNQKKTFSELIDIQLYQYQFKKQKKQNKMKIKQPKDRIEQLKKQYVNMKIDQQISIKDYLKKVQKYERIKAKNNKKIYHTKNQDQFDNIIEKQINNLEQRQQQKEQKEQKELIQKNDTIIKIKNRFSTQKKQFFLYRQKTSKQKAIYNIKYNEFICRIINSYLGIFEQQYIQSNINQKQRTYCNPKYLINQLGQDYLCQNQIQSLLNNHCCQEDAQKIYQHYWISKEALISMNIKPQKYYQNKKQNFTQLLQYLSDFGLVKNIYKVEDGMNVQKQIQNLNINQAMFGEQYRLQQTKDGQYIVKLVKLEHIYPLHTLDKLQKYKQRTNQQQQQQTKLSRITFPQNLLKRISQKQQDNSNIYQQIYNEVGILKKDIEIILNINQYNQQQLQQDIHLQIEIEKNRNYKRQSKLSNFSKDPSNIDIKNKDGYFEVSKYRQI